MAHGWFSDFNVEAGCWTGISSTNPVFRRAATASTPASNSDSAVTSTECLIPGNLRAELLLFVGGAHRFRECQAGLNRAETLMPTEPSWPGRILLKSCLSRPTMSHPRPSQPTSPETQKAESAKELGQTRECIGGPEQRQLEPTGGLAARNRSTQGGSIGLQNLTTGSSPGRATNNADPPVRGGRMRPTASSCSVSLLGGVFAPALAREKAVRGIVVLGTLATRPPAYPGRSERFFTEFDAVDVPAAWAAIDTRLLMQHGPGGPRHSATRSWISCRRSVELDCASLSFVRSVRL